MNEIIQKYFMPDRAKKIFYLFQAIVSAVCINMVLDYVVVSVYSLLFMIGFYYFFAHIDNHCRKDRYIRICAILFSIFILMGKVDYWIIADVSRWEKILRIFFIILGSYCILSHLIAFLFSKYDSFIEEKNEIKCNLSENIIFVISFAIIALVWGIVWMAEYPGVIGTDTIMQIRQFMGDYPLGNHHPVAYTMMLKIQYLFLKSCGMTNINHIFGVMSLLQLLVMDAIVSFQIRFLYKKTKNLFLVLISIIFYVAVLYHASFSVNIMKDIIFSNIVLAFMLVILGYFESQKDGKKNIVFLVGLLLLGIMVNLFRSNGNYAYAFFLLFVVAYGIKERKKKVVLTLMFPFLVGFIFLNVVYRSLGVADRSYAESLSIPLQQIAYVAASGLDIPEEEYELLSQVVDVDKMAAAYTDWISDPVKDLFTNKDYFMKHKAEYLQLWIKLGMRYPGAYVVAYVKQTYGYWYPAVRTWPYLWRVYENPYGIEQQPIFSKKVAEGIEKLADLYSKSPLYGSFCSIATYTWGTICMFCYAMRRRNKVCILNYSLLLGIWISLLLATPVFAEFRYIYPLIISFPLIVFMPYAEHDMEDSLDDALSR